MGSPLVRAWERVEEGPNGMRSIIVFSEGHFAVVAELNERMKSFIGEQPTQAEEAEAYRTMGAGAGPYTISGNTVTLTEVLDREPVGHLTFTCEFAIQGDTLTFTSARTPWTGTAKRIS